jgi:hypothetical protein
MANNLYDYLNQFNLGQLVNAGNTALQGASNALNRAGIGTRGIQSNPSYYGPAYASAEALGIKPGGSRNYGPGYKEKELAAGQAAENFRPGAGFPGQQAERAYQQEKSRIEQLTAQDPELQRYEKARAGAKTQEEMNAARDIGMQIWAQRNPELAKKVKPGQSGYEAIQGTLNAGSMGAPMEIAFDTSNVLGGKPMPQGLSYGTSTPTQIPGGTPIQGGGFPKDKAAMFERFMQGPAANTPTFQGSPLGNATPVGQLNYGGAVQPLGNAISDDFYKTDKARTISRRYLRSLALCFDYWHHIVCKPNLLDTNH